MIDPSFFIVGICFGLAESLVRFYKKQTIFYTIIGIILAADTTYLLIGHDYSFLSIDTSIFGIINFVLFFVLYQISSALGTFALKRGF